MTLKKFGIILFLIFSFLLSFLPVQKILAQTPNTGFVSGNIWYSKDPFEEGDKIKIYTFVFNPDNRELSGTVIFFDNTVLLGRKDFSLAPKTANDVSIDWTATAGDHNIFGKIENAKFLISKGKYEEVYLAENETEKNPRSISKKIIPKTTDSDTTSNSTSISDIKKIIEDKTPSFVTQSVDTTTSSLEKLRNNININSENKKKEIQNEIKSLNTPKTTKDFSTNYLLKPFKYIEVFFLTLFTFILSSKILFYGILIILLFFILRYLWRLVF